MLADLTAGDHVFESEPRHAGPASAWTARLRPRVTRPAAGCPVRGGPDGHWQPILTTRDLIGTPAWWGWLALVCLRASPGRAARIVRHGQVWSSGLTARPGDRGLPGRHASAGRLGRRSVQGRISDWVDAGLGEEDPVALLPYL